MPKETSEEVAALAGKYIDFGYDALATAIVQSMSQNPEALRTIISDVRTLAASALSQRSDADD